MPAKPAHAQTAPAPSWVQRGSGSVSAWARATPSLAPLRDAAAVSAQMWHGVATLLPPALRGGVQPGRWQDAVWSLTASSSAVAAKLSQFKPTLLLRLQEQGFAVRDVRIRVQPQAERTGRATPAVLQTAPCPAAVRARLQALRTRHR